MTEAEEQKILTIATDDYQNRNGAYPKPGIPDMIDVNIQEGKFIFEISFKDTTESNAKFWVTNFVKDHKLKVNNIESWQDGDYQDDWVMVYAETEFE